MADKKTDCDCGLGIPEGGLHPPWCGSRLWAKAPAMATSRLPPGPGAPVSSVSVKRTGVLMYLDGLRDLQGDVVGPECKVTIALHLPVYVEFNHSRGRVGWCDARRDGNKITYEAQIFTDLLMARVADLMFPAAGGKITDRKGDRILAITISEVGLTRGPCDTRILTLGGSRQPGAAGASPGGIATPGCPHEEGATPLGGWVICRRCGANLREFGK